MSKSIYTILLLVITLGGIFLFVVPEYQQASVLGAELAKKQAEYASDSAYDAKVASLASMIDSKKADLATIDTALPSEFSLSPLVYFFQETGAENGLVVKSVTFSQTSDTDPTHPVRDVTLTLDVLGNYEGLKGFLSALDTSARIFEVNSISFTVPANSTSGQSSSQKGGQVDDFMLSVITHTY